MLNVPHLDDLSTQIERGKFHAALNDPAVDQDRLYRTISRFERRRRLQLALAAMPEPTAQDITESILVTLARA